MRHITRLRITYSPTVLRSHAAIAVPVSSSPCGRSSTAAERRRRRKETRAEREKKSVSRLFTRHPLHHLLFIINLTLLLPPDRRRSCPGHIVFAGKETLSSEVLHVRSHMRPAESCACGASCLHHAFHDCEPTITSSANSSPLFLSSTSHSHKRLTDFSIFLYSSSDN